MPAVFMLISVPRLVTQRLALGGAPHRGPQPAAPNGGAPWSAAPGKKDTRQPLRVHHAFHSPLMFTAGNTMDIFGLVVLLCVVAGSSR